jgi:hypothetical protein
MSKLKAAEKYSGSATGMTTKNFNPSLLLLFLDPGSGMGKNQDPGSGINIPDPQHCHCSSFFVVFIGRNNFFMCSDVRH